MALACFTSLDLLPYHSTHPLNTRAAHQLLYCGPALIRSSSGCAQLQRVRVGQRPRCQLLHRPFTTGSTADSKRSCRLVCSCLRSACTAHDGGETGQLSDVEGSVQDPSPFSRLLAWLRAIGRQAGLLLCLAMMACGAMLGARAAYLRHNPEFAHAAACSCQPAQRHRGTAAEVAASSTPNVQQSQWSREHAFQLQPQSQQPSVTSQIQQQSAAECRPQEPARRRLSLQDHTLLLDSQRRGHARPPNSPAWLSASSAQSCDQPKLLPRPAIRFASLSSQAYQASSAGYRFLGLGDLASLALAFHVQQLMLAHVLVKIACVFLVGLPVVYVMGILYCRVSGADLPHGLFKVYGVLYRAPGAKVTEETSLLAGLIMNIVFLLGLFTFAVVLGLISEEIKSQVREIRVGNYPILATDHTLVLGWNSAAVPLLRQMALAKAQFPKPSAFQNLGLVGPSPGNLRGTPIFDGPVVILAEHPKEAMDAAVKGALARHRHLHVLTRHGSPHFLRDLEGVSAGQAKTVIVLQPDTAKEPFKNTAAAVMALRTTRSHWHPSLQASGQTVVIQTSPDDRPVPRTALSGSEDTQGGHMDFLMLRVNTASDIWRLMAQTAIQPGVANVYCAVVQQSRGAASLQICDQAHSNFGGSTYRDARRTFEQGVVVGYIDRGGLRQAHLNPPDDYIMQSGDRLVVLADNGKQMLQPAGMYTNSEFIGAYPCQSDDAEDSSHGIIAQPGAMHATLGVDGRDKEPRLATVAELAGRAASHCHPRGKRIVVVGWPGNIRDLTDGIADFAPPGSQVTVISRGRPADLPEEHGSCTFLHVDGSTTTTTSYEAAGLASADAVIIGSREGVSSQEADAHLLFALMQVQEHVTNAERPRPLHVVSTVRHPETLVVADHIVRDVGRGSITAELIDPDELVSGIITQVAADPDIGAVLSELVETSAGHEIYLRRPEHLGLSLGQFVSFEQVIEHARRKGETAIGYIDEAGSLNLAPNKADMNAFDDHSHIITIAEQP